MTNTLVFKSTILQAFYLLCLAIAWPIIKLYTFHFPLEIFATVKKKMKLHAALMCLFFDAIREPLKPPWSWLLHGRGVRKSCTFSFFDLSLSPKRKACGCSKAHGEPWIKLQGNHITSKNTRENIGMEQPTFKLGSVECLLHSRYFSHIYTLRPIISMTKQLRLRE